MQQGCVCAANFIPADVSDFTYQSNAQTSAPANLPVIGAVCFGVPSTATIEVSVIVNLECIPNTNYNSLVNPRNSYYDVRAMEYALNLNASERRFTVNAVDVFNQTTASADTADQGFMELVGHYAGRLPELYKKFQHASQWLGQDFMPSILAGGAAGMSGMGAPMLKYSGLPGFA